VGHTYGGTLAAYTTSHPQHVTKMVLSPRSSFARGGASMISRLDTAQKLGVYALLPLRPMLAYTLLQVNPQAAHAFAEAAELDARQDRIYNRSRPATLCRDKLAGPALRGFIRRRMAPLGG
jgi:proline iminopeptidase